MNYDIDYEIYQYINQQAENYIPLEELLSQQNLTYDTALQKMAESKEKYHFLLGKYHIRNQNLASLCCDLAEKINQFPENQERSIKIPLHRNAARFLCLCLIS